jgi:hypothetical protein
VILCDFWDIGVVLLCIKRDNMLSVGVFWFTFAAILDGNSVVLL